MIIHTSPTNEKILKDYLGIEFPEFPKTGPVTKDGKTVGHIDNFNGLQMTGKGVNFNELKLLGFSVWNPNEETQWD